MIILNSIEVLLLVGLVVLVLRTCQQLSANSQEASLELQSIMTANKQLINSSQEQTQLAKFMIEDVIRSHRALQSSYDGIAPALESIAKSYSEVVSASIVMAASCERSAEASKSVIGFCSDIVDVNKHVIETIIQSWQGLGEIQKEVMARFEATANVASAASQQAAVTCQQSVEAVIGACEGATHLAAKTCHQILHSAFPEQKLDWSWHHENSFMCYFCQKRFPLTEKETIGKYDYCIEHGTSRKERLLREECGVSQS